MSRKQRDRVATELVTLLIQRRDTNFLTQDLTTILDRKDITFRHPVIMSIQLNNEEFPIEATEVLSSYLGGWQHRIVQYHTTAKFSLVKDAINSVLKWHVARFGTATEDALDLFSVGTLVL